MGRMSETVAVTGHRPEDCEDEQVVRAKLRRWIDSDRTYRVICGMASGVDLWAGDEALRAGKPVWAFKPWAGHGPRVEDRELYARIIEGASRVVNVSESEKYLGPKLYQDRNIAMVNECDKVLAYYNYKPRGGTYNCIKYALRIDVGRPVLNCYDDALLIRI
jgi:uncharacterized phage-like protein YoqJ